VWQDTSVSLRGLTDAAFREQMTGRPLHVTEGALPLGLLLAEFPVALATTGWNRRRDD
jgi:hypothetical protein